MKVEIKKSGRYDMDMTFHSTCARVSILYSAQFFVFFSSSFMVNVDFYIVFLLLCLFVD